MFVISRYGDFPTREPFQAPTPLIMKTRNIQWRQTAPDGITNPKFLWETYWDRFNHMRIPVLDEEKFFATAIEIAKIAKDQQDFETRFEERNRKQHKALVDTLKETHKHICGINFVDIFPCEEAEDMASMAASTGCFEYFLRLLKGGAYGWEADKAERTEETEEIVHESSWYDDSGVLHVPKSCLSTCIEDDDEYDPGWYHPRGGEDGGSTSTRQGAEPTADVTAQRAPSSNGGEASPSTQVAGESTARKRAGFDDDDDDDRERKRQKTESPASPTSHAFPPTPTEDALMEDPPQRNPDQTTGQQTADGRPAEKRAGKEKKSGGGVRKRRKQSSASGTLNTRSARRAKSSTLWELDGSDMVVILAGLGAAA
ncbi:hypothetical protein Trco_000363 [Trichoderma cornu-damae]|uniref:Uncharacterized protein n=1 Tax=Trichoderma cornu-damae TaxID=654480 RepID=A0A9P8TZ74_9HYPO|nr:hypothetical protein Trco_000363 [Trichoderma cornu-damae]